MNMRTQDVQNHTHKYEDSFGNGCCQRLECGLDRDDPVHQTLRDEDIVTYALEAWTAGRFGTKADEMRAKELAMKLRMEGGLAV